jgi:hypothetical protein
MSPRIFQIKLTKEGVERWLNDWMRSSLADLPTDGSSKQLLQIVANLFKNSNSQVRSIYTMITLFDDSNRSEIKLLYPGLRVVLLQFVLLTPPFPAEGGLDSLPTPSISVITDEKEVKMELYNSSLDKFKEEQEKALQNNTST